MADEKFKNMADLKESSIFELRNMTPFAVAEDADLATRQDKLTIFDVSDQKRHSHREEKFAVSSMQRYIDHKFGR